MRISCREDDPGFGVYAEARSIGLLPKVFVDGREQRRCFTADTDLGVAQCYFEDESGQVMLNEARDAALTIEYVGKVTVEFEKEEP